MKVTVTRDVQDTVPCAFCNRAGIDALPGQRVATIREDEGWELLSLCEKHITDLLYALTETEFS